MTAATVYVQVRPVLYALLAPRRIVSTPVNSTPWPILTCGWCSTSSSSPKVVGDLTHVRGSYRTPHGQARSEWTRTDGRFRLTVTVPTNTGAEILVPTLGGRPGATPDRATFVRVDGGYAVYRVPSGTYTFTTTTR